MMRNGNNFSLSSRASSRAKSTRLCRLDVLPPFMLHLKLMKMLLLLIYYIVLREIASACLVSLNSLLHTLSVVLAPSFKEAECHAKSSALERAEIIALLNFRKIPTIC